MQLDERDHKLTKLNGPRGRGYLKSIPIPIGTRPNSAAAPIESSGVCIVPFDNSTDYTVLNFIVPLDYDNTETYDSTEDLPSDQLQLVVLARTDATTTTNTLEVEAVNRCVTGAAAAESLTLSSAQSASQTVPTATIGTYSFDLSGLDLSPGEAVSVKLGCTIAGDTLQIYGHEFRYRTNEVPTDALTNPDDVY